MPKALAKNIDWLMVLSVVLIAFAGLITMSSFGPSASPGLGGEAGGKVGDYFFSRQLLWLLIGLIVFFLFGFVDWRFLRSGGFLLVLWFLGLSVLAVLFLFGSRLRGSLSWFDFGVFSGQPSEPMKLILILVLAKYFSRRHVEIAHISRIIISAFYALVPAVLILLQPDFGSALVVVLIWLGMILVSGVSKKHLFLVILTGVLVFVLGWFFLLAPYQKARIITFVHPLADPRGAGYNALQSMIAVGSGRILGKGIGLGTQSRLEFLPEYQTDFIFAAFAEEWGFAGAVLLFVLFGVLIWRILKNASWGQSNFERLFGIGLSIFITAHFIIHIGMNIGLLPITGIGLPLMSYGGSGFITITAGLGILMGMGRYSTNIHPQAEKEDPVAAFLGS